MKKILVGLALMAPLALQAAPRIVEEAVKPAAKECKLKKRGLDCPNKDQANCDEKCIAAVRSMETCVNEEMATEEMVKADEEKTECVVSKDACGDMAVAECSMACNEKAAEDKKAEEVAECATECAVVLDNN